MDEKLKQAKRNSKPKTYTEEEVIKIIQNLREELSELEHQQWESWSKYVANDLCKINHLAVIDRWRSNWVPYSDLNEKTKDSDRIWADKVISRVLQEFMTPSGFSSAIDKSGLRGFNFSGGEE